MKTIHQGAWVSSKIWNSRKVLFWLLLGCVSMSYVFPVISPPIALAVGLAFALIAPASGGRHGESVHPYQKNNAKAIKWLLQFSVVGLGFGMNAMQMLAAGRSGFGFTVASLVGTLGVGVLLGAILKVRKKTSVLITVGTAICGGSAIAAVAPALNADERDISVSLGTVFILNALALFLFPALGAAFGLSQEQFGVWAAIAIHDTSSVVGAAAKYGQSALQVATTVKLSRALWIIPLVVGIALRSEQQRRRAAQKKEKQTQEFQAHEGQEKNGAAQKPLSLQINIPYFIVLFVLASIASTFIPAVQAFGVHLVALAKTGLTITLFLLGTSLSRSMLTSVGVMPLVQGVLLWIMVSVATLFGVLLVLPA